MLGQRYAYDFVKVDWSKNKKKQKPSPSVTWGFSVKAWRYFLLGVPLAQWYGWGQDVYAPCDGKIVTAANYVKERQRLHLLTDLFVVIKNALFFRPEKHDINLVLGNNIIMQTENAFAFFAHFQKDSICVTEGQEIKAGDFLGRVGHSGNSTAPHLHFHLMDSADLWTAKGVPCAFRRFERFQDGVWEEVINGIPTAKDRIRGDQTV
jgi:murein DD-endopeptidase MepM/ murein hydrolase activator NlpD